MEATISSNTIDGSTAPETTPEACEASETLALPEAAEPSEIFHGGKAIAIPVNPARLAWGRYDHGRNRDVGEGDIHASYSADTIATNGKIRRAFRWQARLMVTVSLYGRRSTEPEQAEAYQLLPVKAFSGTPTTYTEKTEDAEAARNDPNGFYHGMTVKQGRETFVLSGPPVVFMAEEQPIRPEGDAGIEGEQLSLF